MKSIHSFLASFLLFAIPSVVYCQWHNDNLYGGNIAALTANDSAIFALAQGAGIFASFDEGNTWKSISSSSVPRIAANDTSIYAVINNRLNVSYNNGRKWTLSSIVDTSNVTSLFATDGGVYVKFETGNMYFTPNNDMVWEQVSALPSQNIVEVDGTFIKITWQNGVFISYDQGETWHLIPGTEWTQVNKCIVKCNNSAFIGTDKGVFLVNVVDTTLEQKSSNSLITLLSNKGKLFACPWAMGIIISSDNGKTWVSSNEGLTNVHATSIAYDKNLYVTAFEGVFSYNSFTNKWINSSNGITGTFYASSVNNISFNDTNIYLGSENGFFIASKNNMIWNKPTFKNIYKVFFIDNILYGFILNDGIYISNDNGINWREINTGLPEFFYEVKFLPTPTILFELKDSLFLGTNFGLFKSAKNNIRWEATGLNAAMTVNCYAVSDDVIYIGTTENGIYTSFDLGDTWKQVNTGLSGTYIGSLATKGKYLFAGTEQNIFYSDNKGEEWNILGEGFPDKEVVTSIFLTDSIIFAATHSHGLWKLANPFKFNSVIPVKTNLLKQQVAYPNPFNNEIRIDLSGLSPFKSALLFNVAGVLIAKAELPVIQTAYLKPGVYFLKVEFEAGVMYYKMIKN